MTPERYVELEMNPSKPLTREEMAAGWHHCDNWNHMVVGVHMPEYNNCTCFNDNDPKRETRSLTTGRLICPCGKGYASENRNRHYGQCSECYRSSLTRRELKKL